MACHPGAGTCQRGTVVWCLQCKSCPVRSNSGRVVGVRARLDGASMRSRGMPCRKRYIQQFCIHDGGGGSFRVDEGEPLLTGWQILHAA